MIHGMKRNGYNVLQPLILYRKIFNWTKQWALGIKDGFK